MSQTEQQCPWWVDYERGIPCGLPINHTGQCAKIGTPVLDSELSAEDQAVFDRIDREIIPNIVHLQQSVAVLTLAMETRDRLILEMLAPGLGYTKGYVGTISELLLEASKALHRHLTVCKGIGIID